jgi:hypothetical protein
MSQMAIRWLNYVACLKMQFFWICNQSVQFCHLIISACAYCIVSLQRKIGRTHISNLNIPLISVVYICTEWREPRVVFSGSRACSFRLSCIGLFSYLKLFWRARQRTPVRIWSSRYEEKRPNCLFGHFCAFRFYWKCAAQRNIIWCFVYALSKSRAYLSTRAKKERDSL